MKLLSDLIHSSTWRPLWQRLSLALMLLTCGFAFAPTVPTLDMNNGDKVQHILAFLCVSGCSALSARAGWRQVRTSGLTMLVFGVFIELVQSFLPTRSADWRDVVADCVGIAVGLALVAVARRMLPSRAGGKQLNR